MATKRIVAVSTIIHNGEKIEPNQTIDASTFNKDQLTRLYERGVVKIVTDGPDEEQAERERRATLEEATKAPSASSESAETKETKSAQTPTEKSAQTADTKDTKETKSNTDTKK